MLAPKELLPIPPEDLRLWFYSVAHRIAEIRDEWIKGDREQSKLLAAGSDPASSGYAEIMKWQVRAPIRHNHTKLHHDRDLLPLILPHCDPSLRDSILGFLRLTDVDTYGHNADGEHTALWRRSWSAMDLDAELNELLPKIRAAGDRILLKAAGESAVSPSPKTDKSEEKESESRASVDRAEHPVDPGAPDDQWYPARWYSHATDEGLYPDLLKGAAHDGRLNGRKVRGSRLWQYRFDEVCTVWPEYRAALEKYRNRSERIGTDRKK
jgi:hypothetical protein